MTDLGSIYKAFDADEPMPGDDDNRYVDPSAVRSESNIALKLVQKIKNAARPESHHLLMGHTKCGKTTELNCVAHILEHEVYATVKFDVAESASRTFEYTTVLLLTAGALVEQLSARRPKKISVTGASAKKLVEFLRDKSLYEN